MYKVEVLVVNDPKWYSNLMVFDTTEEATDYAMDLSSRWTAVIDTRVVPATP